MTPERLMYLLPVAAAAMALGLAAVVLRSGPRQTANRLLALGLSLAALHHAAFGIATLSTEGLQLSLARTGVAALAALPVAWLAFGLSFASDSAAASRGWRAILALLGGGTLAAWLALAAGHGVLLVPVASGATVWGVDRAGKLVLALVLVGVSLMLLRLENVYRHASSADRWRSKFLVVGTFLAFASQMVGASHAILHGRLHPLHPPLGGLAFLIGEVLIAFSLVRHRLLQVDVFVSRYVVYRSVTVALVGGYLVALGIATEVFRWLSVRLDTVTVVILASVGAAGLALLLLSDHVRRRIQRQLHTHFYKHKYDYRLEWMHLTRRLSRATTTPQIAAETVGRIVEVMWVRHAAMYVRDHASSELVLAHQVEYQELPPTLRLPGGDAGQLRGAADASGGDEEANRQLAALLPAGTPVGLVIPLTALDMLVGVLIVGPECSGKPFGADDHDLLAAVAAQTGALLLNAWMARESAEGRELQALARLSAFIAHDLKNAVGVLSFLAENACQHLDKPAFRADLVRTLGHVTKRMQDVLATLVSPHPERAGAGQPLELARAVDAWLRELGGLVPARIRLETALAWSGVVRADPERLRCVLQNLLLNAVEAIPRDGCIRVETALAGSEALLVVSDTGRGMSREFIQERLFRAFQTSKPGGFGIGLYQCRHYVGGMGGILQVESEEGRGTRVTIHLPVVPSAPAVSAVPAAGAAGGDMAPIPALGRLT